MEPPGVFWSPGPTPQRSPSGAAVGPGLLNPESQPASPDYTAPLAAASAASASTVVTTGFRACLPACLPASLALCCAVLCCMSSEAGPPPLSREEKVLLEGTLDSSCFVLFTWTWSPFTASFQPRGGEVRLRTIKNRNLATKEGGDLVFARV